MYLNQVDKIIVATHIAALNKGQRANCLMLRGGPGVGKTDTVKWSMQLLSRALRQPVGFVTRILANDKSVDLMGFMLPVLDKDTGELQTHFSIPAWYPTRRNTWVFDPPADASEDGTWYRPGEWPLDRPLPDAGTVFLDEWSQTDEDVQKPAANLLLTGGIGERYLPSGYRVLAAGNRLSDRAGATRELSHNINRRCLIPISAHLPSFLQWAQRQPSLTRPHYTIITFASQHPGVVFKDAVPDGNDEYCTARSLVKMGEDLLALRTSDEIHRDVMPTSDIAEAVAAGWIGGAAAAQWLTHLRYFEKIPTIDQIVGDPSGCKVPSMKDEQMVVAYMLSHHVSEELADPLFTYMKRLHREMQLLTVNATLNDRVRATAFHTAKGFSQWLVDNKELLVAVRN